MRVCRDDAKEDRWCEMCDPGKPPPYKTGLTPRQKSGLSKMSS